MTILEVAAKPDGTPLPYSKFTVNNQTQPVCVCVCVQRRRKLEKGGGAEAKASEASVGFPLFLKWH